LDLKMIKPEELNPHKYSTDPETDKNLAILLERLNKVRVLWNKPMIVDSGLRSQADQQRINPSAPKSKHLTGQAADIADKSRELRDWILANMDKMEEIGFWFEDFGHTPTWVHFQIVPPKSGHRIFIP
jgi:uncharacterized protein YcbK (DUF882 family)